MQITKERILRLIIDFICITAGAALAAFALEEFLIPNLILDGGVNGVSIILGNLTGVSISVFVICLNIPFLILGMKTMGKEFLIKTGYAMIVFSLLLEVFATQGEATDDMLLATIYGGILLGVAVGVVIRFGGCLDGTEVAAILINKKSNFSAGQVVLGFNFVIYSVAGLLFGLDRALYSLLTYFICFKIIDMVVDGFDQTKSAIIITNQAEEIANDIFKTLGRTVTLMDGKGLINGDTKILYVVVTRLELSELKEIVDKPDRQAFITISDVSEIYGNHIKRKPKPKKPKKENNVVESKEAGVTLTSMVITIVILGVLAGVAFTTGNYTLQSAKLTEFSAELKIMQLEVDGLNQEYENGNNDILNTGKALTGSQDEKTAFAGAGISNTADYRFFDASTIENLGIEDVSNEFLVNIKTRDVISLYGLNYKGETYYTVEQVPDGMYKVNGENS